MIYFLGYRVRAGEPTWKFFDKNIFCFDHLPNLIPKLTQPVSIKNIFEHSLDKQTYNKLTSNRKKLKSMLKIRFHDRLDVESDIAVQSFRASCVSSCYSFTVN